MNTTKRNTAFTLIELLIVIAILAILVVTLGGLLTSCNTSTGSRVGIVSKVSYKGAVFNSWEGEMLVGKGESANVWAFSMDNTAIVEEVKQAMRDGKIVELEYKQRMFKPLKRDTAYTITAVKQLK